MRMLITVLAVCVLASGLRAQQAMTLADAWVTVPAADGTAEAYVSIANPTMYDVYVVSASTDAAGSVELRDGDKPVKEITVASYGSADLKPGGGYLKLLAVTRPLKAGDEIQLTLVTDGGVTLVTTAVVKAR